MTKGIQQDLHEITIGESRSLTSETLGEERAYWVYLPASYNKPGLASQRYPVLYLLDGAAHFHSASGVVQFMGSGPNGNIQIPELIIVAIPNTNRLRDLTPTPLKMGPDEKETAPTEETGGGIAFLQFIRDELAPEIESTYRTLPYRILVGHSLGGLLALYALLDAPDMFQSYVAIDPSLWWDDQVLVRRAEREFSGDEARRGAVYISLANHSRIGPADGINRGDEAVRKFAKSLESAASPSFRSTLQYFEAENHVSVPLLSLYHGLLYIFEGYKPSAADPTALSAHFERISDRLGVVLLPPEEFVNNLGYGLLHQDVDKAIEFFKLNGSYYPESINVHESLGEAYMVKGENSSAIEHYERALELCSDNSWRDYLKKQLETLRNQRDQK